MTRLSRRSWARRNRWGRWVPPVLAVILVAVLICLASVNVVVRANWTEIVDGVLWSDLSEGVTAVAIGEGEAGQIAGIRRGDVLLAIDGIPAVSYNI